MESRIKPGFLVVHMLLAICCAVVAYFGYYFVNISKYKSVDSLGDNWSLSPIINAELSSKNCSEIGMIDLITDQWPGMNEGCDCSGQSSNPEDTVTEGSCSRFKGSSQKKCKDIPSISNSTYSIWRNQHLCGRRMKNTTYLNLYYCKKGDVCKTGYKQCGLVDTLENRICIKIEEQCPLNFIKIVSADSTLTYSDPKYTVSNSITNGEVLVTSNKLIENKLVIQFLVSQGKPCLDNSYFNFDFETNVLSKMYDRNQCQSITQDNLNQVYEDSIEVDEDSLIDVFECNNISDSLNTISNYKFPSKEIKVKLYTRNYNGIKVECKNKIIEEGKSEKLTDLGNFRDEAKGVKLLAAYGACFCLACFVLILLNYVYFIVSYVFFKSRDYFFEIGIMMYPFIIVTCLGQCVTLTMSYSKSVNGTDFSVYVDGCTDNSNQSIISVFNSNFTTGQLLILLSLILSYLFLVLNLFLYCKKKNKILVEDDNSNDMVEKQIY